MIPRILISAPSSYCGKTTVVLALLSLLAKKFGAENVSSFKCGPDFIDGLFHAHILKDEIPWKRRGNLDLFFTESEKCREIFQKESKNSQIAVIEGAMGYFDGKSFKTDASAWEIAKTICAPAVLVFDARKKAVSICAEICGFLHFREENGDKSKIAGIILNRASKKSFETLSKKIENECQVKVLGYLPEISEIKIESRHLGLFTPDAVLDLDKKIELLAETAEKTLDLEKIIEIARSAPKIESKESKIEKKLPPKTKIAVAADSAFCFYYRENFDLLCENGAELLFFSPLANEKVPDDAAALYIGGGYPELFADALLENSICADSVRDFAHSSAPIFAECGGFLYLQMIGVLPGTFWNAQKLVRFGYAELTANDDNFLCKKGEKARAHCFHHFETSENGESFTAQKDGKSWKCVQFSALADSVSCGKNILAGFPHFYFPSNPALAENFVNAAFHAKNEDVPIL